MTENSIAFDPFVGFIRSRVADVLVRHAHAARFSFWVVGVPNAVGLVAGVFLVRNVTSLQRPVLENEMSETVSQPG